MSEQLVTRAERYAAYHANELIVALPHLKRVEHVLREARVDWTVMDRSPALDLARLSVPEPEGGLRLPTPAPDDDVDASAPPPATDHIGTLLAYLRGYFKARHAGWTPTLGKNRLVGAVHGGGGVISHGGGGTPLRTSDHLPQRGAGPGRGVRVGVLDSGFAPQSWLAGGWEARYSDRIPKADEYAAPAGHATFVTGLILSQAPAATVEVRQVLRQDDNGEYVADSWTVANEIVALGRRDLDVLNISLVCHTEKGDAPLLLATAIDRLDPELVVVAAAGNHGDVSTREHDDSYEYDEHDDSKPTFPAALDDVVAVGAATRAGHPAPFTPKNKSWIDLLAVGDEVLSTFLDGKVDLGEGSGAKAFGGFARWSGSSFAAALVSGAIAAGVQPGLVTARQSLEDIVTSAERNADENPDHYVPPFLRLDVK